jgi:hypothetical protein
VQTQTTELKGRRQRRTLTLDDELLLTDSQWEAASGVQTDEEASSIVDGTIVIFLELAARFAADALNEAYFGWSPERFASRGDHHLARARNQLAAARDLDRQRAAAGALVAGQFSRATLAG